MDVSAKWRYFCELSAFGIQEKTSAAVVAESDVKVLVIPVDVFNEVIERNSSWKTQFFQSITKRLAELLRSLHTRTISLSSLNITASGQQIHNEVFFVFFFIFFKSFFLFPFSLNQNEKEKQKSKITYSNDPSFLLKGCSIFLGLYDKSRSLQNQRTTSPLSKLRRLPQTKR